MYFNVFVCICVYFGVFDRILMYFNVFEYIFRDNTDTITDNDLECYFCPHDIEHKDKTYFTLNLNFSGNLLYADASNILGTSGEGLVEFLNNYDYLHQLVGNKSMVMN